MLVLESGKEEKENIKETREYENTPMPFASVSGLTILVRAKWVKFTIETEKKEYLQYSK